MAQGAPPQWWSTDQPPQHGTTRRLTAPRPLCSSEGTPESRGGKGCKLCARPALSICRGQPLPLQPTSLGPLGGSPRRPHCARPRGRGAAGANNGMARAAALATQGLPPPPCCGLCLPQGAGPFKHWEGIKKKNKSKKPNPQTPYRTQKKKPLQSALLLHTGS